MNLDLTTLPQRLDQTSDAARCLTRNPLRWVVILMVVTPLDGLAIIGPIAQTADPHQPGTVHLESPDGITPDVVQVNGLVPPV